MEKSPYEIRLELLKLAADHVRDSFFHRTERVNRQFDALALDTDPAPPGSLEYKARLREIKRITAALPVIPTVDDIMHEAVLLRQFVDDRVSHRGVSTNGKPAQLLNE